MQHIKYFSCNHLSQDLSWNVIMPLLTSIAIMARYYNWKVNYCTSKPQINLRSFCQNYIFNKNHMAFVFHRGNSWVFSFSIVENEMENKNNSLSSILESSSSLLESELYCLFAVQDPCPSTWLLCAHELYCLGALWEPSQVRNLKTCSADSHTQFPRKSHNSEYIANVYSDHN